MIWLLILNNKCTKILKIMKKMDILFIIKLCENIHFKCL